ncbi:hypothetical protein [Mycolicibacterium sp. XJ1819]
MVYELVVIYLGGWFIVTIGLCAVGRHLADRRAPTAHPFGLSFFAAALWPVLLLGMMELTSAAVYARTRSRPEPSAEVLV